MALTDSIPRTKNGLVYSAVVTLGMAATVGSALAFEYLGGYMPCHLCLIERDPYYYGVPIGILGIGAAVMSLPPWVTRMILVILGIMMLIGAGIGIYHSGVEWGFWAGPSSCTSAGGSGATNAGDLLSSLNAVHGPQCDQAALRILGLSLAGWNVVASVVLAAVAFVGAKKAA